MRVCAPVATPMPSHTLPSESDQWEEGGVWSVTMRASCALCAEGAGGACARGGGRPAPDSLVPVVEGPRRCQHSPVLLDSALRSGAQLLPVAGS